MMPGLLRSLVLPVLMVCVAACDNTPPPGPYGPVPTPAQLAWQKMEYNMFIHFGPNTFTDVEWGHGREEASVFNPTDVDCDQWAATAKAAGMNGIILTAKHHDGFCLWPSATSAHTVARSPWRGGRGDLLRELSDACRRHGLKFGVYLSPWDQNHPTYGTSEYNEVFRRALDEVLGGYGEVFEQWFDGACGEGPNGKRQVYDWKAFHQTVYKHQPQAVIFSDIGPGCRWIGNERGYAGTTCWSRLDTAGFGPGLLSPPLDTLNRGNVHGQAWVPGEVDVSIRPGWFYHADEDHRVKSVDNLMDIYYSSVGRNSLLLLNVPPDRSGRIFAADSLRLMEFRAVRERDFAVNIAEGAVVQASSVRGNSRRYAAGRIVDGQYDTYWTTDDGVTTAEFIMCLPRACVFNRIVLQEYIPLGQRVAGFTVDYRREGEWVPLAEGTTIGYKRILRVPQVEASEVRVRITRSFASPLINNMELYNARESVAAPVIERNKEGEVSIRNTAGGDPEIYYTLDGTTPDINSTLYTAPFAMPGRGKVRAVAVNALGSSEAVSATFDVAPAGWRIIGAGGGLKGAASGSSVSETDANAGYAVDGCPHTFARFDNQEVLCVDMGVVLNLNGFSYTPVPDSRRGAIMRYDLSVSVDGFKWERVITGGVFDNIANNPICREVRFRAPAKARYLRLSPVETVNSAGGEYYVAEIGVLTALQ